MTTFTIAAFQYNDESTSATSINSAGEVVGYLGSYYSGFTYDKGIFSIVTPPAGGNIKATVITGDHAINDAGSYVGTFIGNTTTYPFIDGSLAATPGGTSQYRLQGISDTGLAIGNDYNPSDGSTDGFTFQNGAITPLTDPAGAAGSTIIPNAISKSGLIAGTGVDPVTGQLTIYSIQGSTYTKIGLPGAGIPNSLEVSSINDSGDIVGSYYTGSNERGFLYTPGGGFTDLVDPGESANAYQSPTSYATSINDEGQVLGYYPSNGNGSNVGFVYSNGTYSDITVPGAFDVYGESINDSGIVAGTALVNMNGTYEGFIATPVPAATVAITSAAEQSGVRAQTINGIVTADGSATIDGQPVTFTDNGTTLATTAPVITDANGRFTGQVTLPYDGANSIVAQSQDSDGHVGTSSPVVDTLVTTPAPTVTQVSTSTLGAASSSYPEIVIGAGDALTIYLQTSDTVTVTGTPTLTLSNGTLATYSTTRTSGGYPFGPVVQTLVFTYTPTLIDASGPLAITGLDLPNGASILDSANDELIAPAGSSLGLAVQTAPTLSFATALNSDGAIIGSATPYVYGTAEEGDTITLSDTVNGVTTVVGSTIVPQYGSTPAIYTFALETSPLPEGENSFTAVASDGTGATSAVSAVPLVITVDTVPPSEMVTGLTIVGPSGVANALNLADETAADTTDGSIEIMGTLSAPLATSPGPETVEIHLPGIISPLTANVTGTDFTLLVPAADVDGFGVDGTISASIQAASGLVGATYTQAFAAASTRIITPIVADPADSAPATGSTPALSGNGEFIAFAANPNFAEGEGSIGGGAGGPSFSGGIYIEDLISGVTTELVAGENSPAPHISGSSLSNDGSLLAFQQSDSVQSDQIFIANTASGATRLVSANFDGSSVDSDGSAFAPTLSSDGTTIAFGSVADDLVAGFTTPAAYSEQIYVGTTSGPSARLALVSSANGSSLVGADGESSAPSLSADGGSIAFASTATDLLPQPIVSGGSPEIYVETLTGPGAGAVKLVSGLTAPDGAVTVADNTTLADASISGDGRYVVFASSADNLGVTTPNGAALPGGTEIYLEDLATGTISLVSDTADGTIADSGSSNPVISADGHTVVFQSCADNLAPGTLSGYSQIYSKDLTTGALTLLSEPGNIPGNGFSENPTVSADGTKVAFDSTATDLVAGAAGAANYGVPSQVYLTGNVPGHAPAAAPPTIAFTSTSEIDTTSEIAVRPFLSASVGDSNAGANDVLTITVGGTGGTLSGRDLGGGVSGVYTLSGTPSAINVNLELLSFTPKAGGPGTSSTSTFTLSDTSDATATVATATGSNVVDQDPVATPTIDAPVAITDSTTPTLTGTGEPGSTITLTTSAPVILLGPRPTIGTKTFTLGQTTVGVDGTWSFTVGVTAGKPLQGQRSPSGEATVFTFAATASKPGQIGSGTATSSPLDLDTSAPGVALTTLSSTNAAPATIGGTIAVDAENPPDDQDGALAVTLTDVDTLNGATTTTTTTGNASAGAFAFPFLGTPGTHVITASATDAAGNVGASASITIQIDPVAPTITVKNASTSTIAEAPVLPFAGVTIGDANLDASETLTIAVGGVGGLLSGQGLTSIGNGGYTLAGDASTVTRELDALSFTPTAGSGQASSVSTFALSDKSTSYLQPAVDTSVTVKDASRASKLPTLTLTASPAPVVVGGGETFHGTIDVADAGDLITLSDTDASGNAHAIGTTTADVTGAYSLTAALSAGSMHNLTVSATNSLGKGTSNSIELGVFAFGTSDALAEAQVVATDISQNSNAGADQTKLTFVTGAGTTSSTTPDVIIASAGADTVVATANLTNLISTGNSTVSLANGTNANLVFGGGNNTISTGQGSNDTIVTGAGSDTVFALGNDTVDVGAGKNVVFGGSGTSNIIAYGTGDLIALGSGAATVAEGGTGALVYGGSGSDLIADTGDSDTIIGGTGAETVFGGQAGLYYLGTGSNLFASSTAANGSDTIVGAQTGGSETVFGGTSDLVFAGNSSLTFIDGAGGSATISGGAGKDTIFGAAGSSLVFYGTNGGSLIRAGAGNETLNGASSTAGVTFDAGAGAARIVGGSGPDTIFGGMGSNTVTGGAGANTYAFVKGNTGGSEVITDLKGGDQIVLIGYGAGAVASALATATTSSIGTTITLADGTKVTFTGSPKLNTSNIAGDGYLAGSTVGYLDQGAPAGTVRIDPNQPTMTTDFRGDFVLEGGTGPFVLTGGTDMATGLAFTGILEAPVGSTDLNPTTTLLEKIVEAGGDTGAAGIAAANATLVAALGLPAGTDLTSLDPEAGTLSGDATATKVFAAGGELLDVYDLIQAAGGSGTAALAALAATIASGATLDLTNPATLAAAATAGGLSSSAAAAVATIVTATEAALAQQLAMAPNATSVFEDITGASIAQQGVATSALAAARAAGGNLGAAAATYAQTAASTLAAAIATATSANGLPTISGTVANQAITDLATVRPFSAVTVTTPSLAPSETMTITETADGAASDADGLLSGADLVKTGVGTYSLTEPTSDALTAGLQALVFTPTLHQVAQGASVTTGFTLSVGDVLHPSVGDSTTSVIVASTAAILTLASPVLTVEENTGATPIGIVAPSDSAYPASALALVVTALPSDGTVTLEDGITAVSAGETLDVAQLTSLEFAPTPGAFDASSSFGYTATDPAGNSGVGTATLAIGPGATATTDTTTTVTDSDAAIAPTITGTAAGQTTKAEGAVTPFAGVTIGDGNGGNTTETLTITLGGAGGTLTGNGLSGSGGSYSLSGSAATVTGELDALSFTPTAGQPGTGSTTRFTLSDTSSGFGAATTDNTTTVTPTSVDDAIKVALHSTYVGNSTFRITGTASSTAGVTGIEITADVDGKTKDLGNATLRPDGTFTFLDHVGSAQQGSITATLTDGVGGAVSATTDETLSGVQKRSPASAVQKIYDAKGDFPATDTYHRDGSQTLAVESSGQTFKSTGFETFDNHGQANTTFVFAPGHGLGVVDGFLAASANHDTVSLKGSDFGKSLAAVLRNTIDSGGSAVIFDDVTHDIVRIAGVTKEQLAAYPKDFTFHA